MEASSAKKELFRAGGCRKAGSSKGESMYDAEAIMGTSTLASAVRPTAGCTAPRPACSQV